MNNLHEALKSTVVAEIDGNGANFKLIELQNGKTDRLFSLHIRPTEWSTAGFQSTDFLGLIGFTRCTCPFFRGECYVREVKEGFDLDGFSKGFPKALNLVKQADQKLQSCGMFVPTHEGWGFFFGKPSRSRVAENIHVEGNGHRGAKIEQLKKSSDQYFTFILTFIEAVHFKGWTIHYIPINPPLTQEIQAVMTLLGIKGYFDECPQADFQPCQWRFWEFVNDEQTQFRSADRVHSAFDAHQKLFSKGIEELLEAHSILHHFGPTFLNFNNASPGRANISPLAHIPTSAISQPKTSFPSHFDVAISFAKPEREKAETLARIVRNKGFNVFYDDFYPEQLWGKDLPVFFDEIYRKNSRYCVMFISKEYVDRVWTNHERQCAQARALQEKGKEYILPLRIDDTELPGMPPTIGHLSLTDHSIEQIADMLVSKLNQIQVETKSVKPRSENISTRQYSSFEKAFLARIGKVDWLRVENANRDHIQALVNEGLIELLPFNHEYMVDPRKQFGSKITEKGKRILNAIDKA